MITITKSLLLVTQDESVLKNLSATFLSHNYSVIVERSVIKSILKVLQQKIDLMIIDIDDSFTFELIDIIKRTRPHLPIIILSDEGASDKLIKLIQAGVLYRALKPLHAQEIERLLDVADHVYKLRGNINKSFYQHYKTNDLIYN